MARFEPPCLALRATMPSPLLLPEALEAPGRRDDAAIEDVPARVGTTFALPPLEVELDGAPRLPVCPGTRLYVVLPFPDTSE